LLPLPLIATRESYAFRVTNDAHPKRRRERSPMIVSNVAKFSGSGRAAADYLTAPGGLSDRAAAEYLTA
jgi:hypothetical protein